MPLHLGPEGFDGEGEHAAVPEKPAALQIPFGGRPIRFLLEGDDLPLFSALDVPIAGLRVLRGDAEGDDRAAARQFRRLSHCFLKFILIPDDMVGRQDQQDRPGGVVPATVFGGGTDGRGGIAAERLEDNGVLVEAFQFVDLGPGDEPVLLADDDERRQHRRQSPARSRVVCSSEVWSMSCSSCFG